MNLSSLRRISAVGWLDVDPAAKTLCAANHSNTIRPKAGKNMNLYKWVTMPNTGEPATTSWNLPDLGAERSSSQLKPEKLKPEKPAKEF